MALEKLPAFPGDEIALQAIDKGENCFIDIYEYPNNNVVLGRTTSLSLDINVAECNRDGVPILRRKGGGGAVFLARGVWVITACYANFKKGINIPLVLENIALEIAHSLEQITNVRITLRGMGDLCIGDRKILGSSLYNGRGAILYQGSLLVDNDLSLISKFLKHPSKEPEYRGGRSHEEFITNLFCISKIDTAIMKQCLMHRLQTFKI